LTAALQRPHLGFEKAWKYRYALVFFHARECRENPSEEIAFRSQWRP
jgi:hypothetical protein